MKILETTPVTGFSPRRAAVTLEAGETETRPASHALVPVEQLLRTLQLRLSLARPDATFVAHLIATATQTPQTRLLRRATSADALATYGQAKGRDPARRPRDGSRLTRVA